MNLETSESILASRSFSLLENPLSKERERKKEVTISAISKSVAQKESPANAAVQSS